MRQFCHRGRKIRHFIKEKYPVPPQDTALRRICHRHEYHSLCGSKKTGCGVQNAHSDRREEWDRILAVGDTCYSHAEEVKVYNPDGKEIVARDNEVAALRSVNPSKAYFNCHTDITIPYDELAELLRYEREHGYVVWVMGPAFTFDAGARQAFSKMIAGGYVDAVLAGNALATHDLEGAYLHTALGQDLYTRKNVPNGHYNHLDTINQVNACGSIAAFLEKEKIQDGIIYHCEKHHVPYVLAGSIRDDGPLAPVYGDVYAAQEAMRAHVRKATTVICMATMLHTIAVGNMTPSYRVLEDGTVRQLYFYCVDISEFTVNKLCDRGSLAAKGIVTNVQDFIVKLSRELGL